MKTVRLFDLLSYDGHAWQFVPQDGPHVALNELISGRIRKVGVAEVLGDESFLHDVPDRLPRLDSAAVLETLDPVARECVLFLRRHIVEVLTGQPPAKFDGYDEDSSMPTRREYDSKFALKDRVAARVFELVGNETLWGAWDFRTICQGIPRGRYRRVGRRTDTTEVLTHRTDFAAATSTVERLPEWVAVSVRWSGVGFLVERDLQYAEHDQSTSMRDMLSERRFDWVAG